MFADVCRGHGHGWLLETWSHLMKVGVQQEPDEGGNLGWEMRFFRDLTKLRWMTLIPFHLPSSLMTPIGPFFRSIPSTWIVESDGTYGPCWRMRRTCQGPWLSWKHSSGITLLEWKQFPSILGSSDSRAPFRRSSWTIMFSCSSVSTRALLLLSWKKRRGGKHSPLSWLGFLQMETWAWTHSWKRHRGGCKIHVVFKRSEDLQDSDSNLLA